MKKSPNSALIGKLNRLGLIDYKPNQELSKGQKGWLTKVVKANRELIKFPERFDVKKVSKSSAKDLKSSGYQITKSRRAIIPKKGFEKITLSKGQLTFEGKNHKTGKKITEKVTLTNTSTFDKKLKELSGKKLKQNQMLTVKIGDNAAFNTAFKSYGEMLQYLRNFEPKDPGMTRAKIARYISIVEIEGKRNSINDDKTKSKDRKNKFNRRN